jgi:hypothetical protein
LPHCARQELVFRDHRAVQMASPYLYYERQSVFVLHLFDNVPFWPR